MPVMPYKKQAVSALLSLLQGKIDTPTEITRARVTKKLGIGGQEDRSMEGRQVFGNNVHWMDSSKSRSTMVVNPRPPEF